MNNNSLVVLGSSSGFPLSERATSGYVLKKDNSLSLIDCGGGITRSFNRSNLNPLQIDRIFISHTHPDHCCELPLIIQLIYLKKRLDPLEIYLPDEFVKPFGEYLKAVYLIKERMPFELKIIGYSEGVIYDELFKMEAIANNHLVKYEQIIQDLNLPNRMMCHSFRIELDNKRILYSADIDSLDDIKSYLGNNEIVLVEASHIDLVELIEMIPELNVGKIIITHITTEEQADNIKNETAKYGVTNLTTAYDGMIVDL